MSDDENRGPEGQAAAQDPPAPEPAAKTGWLIELEAWTGGPGAAVVDLVRYIMLEPIGQPGGVTMNGTLQSTTSPHDALCLGSEADAARIIKQFRLEGWQAVEHAWEG